MMTLEQTAKLYATVLRQLLPVGGYDTSPNTVLAKDIYAHALAFAKADLSAKRLLQAIGTVPVELLPEYETDYGLPLKCTTNVGLSTAQRQEILNFIIGQTNVFNRDYIFGLFHIFGITIVELITHKPVRCNSPCTAAVNTEQLRYKVKLKLQSPVTANVQCIIDNYLPAFLRIDIEVI